MIVINLASDVKESLVDLHRRSTDACVRRRAAIILDLAEGLGAARTARRQRVARTTVYDVHRLWLRRGIVALFDGRFGNGPIKADEAFRRRLGELVAGSPLDHGWPRPTWTLELLALAMHQKTGVLVSAATICRLLEELRARRGRPRPVVPCPWPKARREARIAELKRLPETLPPDEDCFHEDEVDVHLNPKIGLDWMMPGQQKIVVTPGKNEKRYLAGARDVRTGRLVVVEGAAKTSALFVSLLWALFRTRRRGCRRVHVILDNYCIHKSRMVQQALEAFGGRVVLHFLPPYCPQANRIERVWLDLHAEVTRNHRHRTMHELMADVHAWIDRRNDGRVGDERRLTLVNQVNSRFASALESCKAI
jgi:transposase